MKQPLLRVFHIVFVLIAPSSVVSGTELIADFDGFPEGSIGTEFIDGGIRFSNLQVEATGGIPRFSAERAEANGWPHISPPNYLSTFGFFPGPGGGLSQVRSYDITPPSAARAATIDVFLATIPDVANRVFTLTAFREGDVVAAHSVVVGTGTTIIPGFNEHHLFRISQVTFDSLKFAATDQNGNPSAVLAATDNVVIRLIPERSSLTLTLLISALASRCRRFYRS